MARHLNDYILRTEGVDWLACYRPWADVLPGRSNLIIVSRFGDPFVMIEDGSVWMLDVNFGRLTRLADDREHFADLMAIHGPEWLLMPLVDSCRAAGRGLLRGQCYAFTRPPPLGGAYSVENVHAADVDAHLAGLGALHQRTRRRENLSLRED